MNQQLLIRNGVIEAVRSAGEPIADDYQLIDANGVYLAPGLFDMHVHAFDRKYLALTLSYGVTSVRNMGGYPMHLRWKKQLIDGEWLGPHELQKLRASAENPSNAYLTFGRLLEFVTP